MVDMPASLAPQAEVVADIRARLAAIATEQTVAIPLAVESGSRAWGFPSPDSDYDCRFVFVRPLHRHLTLFPERDVIEEPLTPLLDINGWELAKAITLMLKGNAVILEWLGSPLVYRAERRFVDDFLALAETVVDRAMIARHYLHLGLGQRRAHLGDPAAVAGKKLFYTLRPALALRWLRVNPQRRVPPMDLASLLRQSEVAGGICALVEELVRQKAQRREIGTVAMPDELIRFIDAEFALADAASTAPAPRLPEHLGAADRFFQDTIRRFDTPA